MAVRLLTNAPDRSPEWHTARARRVGGSDIGVIMGYSPFQTYDGLIDAKLGLVAPRETTGPLERGVFLEDGIRNWLVQKESLELDLEKSNGMWVWEENDRFHYSPDGVTTDGHLVEIKCPEFRDEEHGWGRQGRNSDKIPIYYRAQVVWGMGLFGAPYKKTWVGALSAKPRFEFARYRVSFTKENQYAFEVFQERALRFLEDLDQREAAVRSKLGIPEDVDPPFWSWLSSNPESEREGIAA